MTATNDSTFSALCDQVRQRWGNATQSGSTGIDGAEKRIPERLVQAIWYERLLRTDGLKTVSGKSLEIHGAGRWNESAGPDFLGADFSINGKRMRADVEVHVKSSDWEKHAHSKDFAYNGVALHVVMTNDDSQQYDTLHNGERTERFEMSSVLFPDFETIRQTLMPEDYPYNSEAGLGRCHEYLLNEDEDVVRQLLASGGRERMETKIRRLQRQAGEGDLNQIFFQALMTAMGFKGNKTLFFLLAKRAPIEELLGQSRHLATDDRIECIQATLLHVAGLTPRSDDSAQLPPDTIEYLNRINRHWAEVSNYFSDRLIPPTRRWHSGVRPVNFPERRLAGIARFLVKHSRGTDLFAPFMERFQLLLPDTFTAKSLKQLLKAAEQLFIIEDVDDFWSRHYSFQAKPAATPMSLIGNSRARSIVFNTVLPLVLLHARNKKDFALEKKLWRWFEQFPELESNNIERFMRYRLFGNAARGASLIHGEMMQQGLFQIFHSCCNNNERDCSQCVFLKAT